MLEEEPKERPEFSQLVIIITISVTLEALAGYMDFPLVVKDEQLFAAEREPRAGGSSVQLPMQ